MFRLLDSSLQQDAAINEIRLLQIHGVQLPTYIGENINKNDFEILEEKLIGSNVYAPLADYYSKNRESIQKKILKSYSSSVEKILWKSIKKMRETSEKNIIDYLLLSCKKN